MKMKNKIMNEYFTLFASPHFAHVICHRARLRRGTTTQDPCSIDPDPSFRPVCREFHVLYSLAHAVPTLYLRAWRSGSYIIDLVTCCTQRTFCGCISLSFHKGRPRLSKFWTGQIILLPCVRFSPKFDGYNATFFWFLFQTEAVWMLKNYGTDWLLLNGVLHPMNLKDFARWRNRFSFFSLSFNEVSQLFY